MIKRFIINACRFSLFLLFFLIAAEAGAIHTWTDNERGNTYLPTESALEAVENRARDLQNEQEKYQNMINETRCSLDLPKITQSYDYLETDVFKVIAKSELAPPIADEDEALEFVKENFFSDIPLTDYMAQELVGRRGKYADEAPTELMKITEKLKDYIEEDINYIPTFPTEGCGIIQDIELNTEIIKALSKQTVAEIVVQILAMEQETVATLREYPQQLLTDPQAEQ
ncbi:MAG: hypothetical protein LBU87_03875 [Lactobacillales bacterium]|jgi:hypothetical protein|nr:hypothetical protein [Lactobacillales bacterium]